MILQEYNQFKSIAIMGGTFDPIHYGHLVTAETVRDILKVELVVFMPSGNPPHKAEKRVSTAEDRYNMTVLATKTNPYFEVSRMEIDRQGYTYTVDTLTELRKIVSKETAIYFITGADAISQIFSWKEPDKLLEMCEFVAVTRPGIVKQDLKQKVEQIQDSLKGKVNFLEVPSLDISSSDIRDRVKKGNSIKYLLPENVEEYINKMGLYS